MNEFAPLPRAFYKPSAARVAPALLGHWLMRRVVGGFCGGPIVETEAYLCNDPACHGARGPTERNRVMFGEPGFGYVYLIYGYHFCVNAVCRPAGAAEAVLIRAVEPAFGPEIMSGCRPVEELRQLTNGPAKLCQALAIDRRHNGLDLCSSDSEMFIARNPAIRAFRRERGPVVTTTRIGIRLAAELPLRFYLEKSLSVSRRVRFRTP
jgi:DNA-3-methyladenine glycosylase